MLRHAHPIEETHGRCYGASDIGLSPLGQRHAQLLARTLTTVPLSAVYSSPLNRAVATAVPLGEIHGLTPIIDDALREIDFGEFEGHSYEEIERAHPAIYAQWMATPTGVRFPGGESYAIVRSRALASMEVIRSSHDGETVAVVSHAGVLRAMLGHCLAMPDEAIFRIEQGYGAINIVDWIGSTPVVRLMNGQMSLRGRTGQAFLSSAVAPLVTEATT
jgi:alpha-ribazole phosphatase/probable phosphoglycerate mutase